MLIAITLVLTPQTDTTLPGHLGRANYAAALARIAGVDAALAAAIHDGDGPKPLTCSSLLNMPNGLPELTLRAGQRYFLRVTGLHAAVSQALAACLLEARPSEWELDQQRFPVTDVLCDPAADAWSGRTSYEDLAAQQLTRSDPPERTVRLQFASPTAFKSAGMTIPVPLPNLVFGSLVERWNAFSAIALSPDMRRFGEEVMAISQYQLRSAPVTQKDKGLRIGGVGEVTYRAMSNDRYWIGVMHMLSEFARFSGVGMQTATGMGQARKIGG
jgi:CRISPR-associated endoribonuclease Cas6